MILMHSLSTNDELAFTKYVRKISTRHQEDLKDKLALLLFNTFKGKTMLDALDMIKFKSVKDLFDQAMQMSIETKREIISFDLIKFAIRTGFQMAITEK